MDPKIRNIAIGGVAAVILAAAGLTALLDDGYKTIKWDRPSTDAEWAEDVKQENLDLKSTEVLQEMLDTHSKKLERLSLEYKKFDDCPECIKYDYIKPNLDAAGLSTTTSAIDKEFDRVKLDFLHDIEMLSRSIERMENELRLRSEGFVVPDKNKAGVKTSKAELQAVESDKIREIHD